MYWLPVILILPYFILLINIYRGLLKIRTFYPLKDPEVFVSVVIACRNEEANLPALLRDISLQDYPENLYEVIIVNDNSTDNTFETASEYSGIKNLVTLNNIGTGKKQALRTGIIAAKGSLIMTTDADCRMDKQWISTIAGFFEKNNPDMIICPVQIEPTSNFFGRFQELEFLSLQGITAGTAANGNAVMCNGANLTFRKDAYLKNSMNMHFEIYSGDDVFLLHALKKENQSIISWFESREAVVTTVSSLTMKSFLHQRKRWISKSNEYKDKYTIILAIVTLIAVLLQFSYLMASLIFPSLVWIFLIIILLKSIPDFLILFNTSGRYGKRNLMRWFVPIQLIYPFYVLGVLVYSLISNSKSIINFPFPKET